MSNHPSDRDLINAEKDKKPSPTAQAILDAMDNKPGAPDVIHSNPVPPNPRPNRANKPKPSAAQIAANKANATKSTGPRTPSGKARASRNATTHGLLAQQPAPGFTHHEATTLAQLTAAYTAQFAPQSPLETDLVTQLASLRHRLQRIAPIESGLFANSIDGTLRYDPLHNLSDPTAPPTPSLLAKAYGRTAKHLHLLTFYETRLSRDFHRTLLQLHALQQSRALTATTALPAATQQKQTNEPNSTAKPNPVNALPSPTPNAQLSPIHLNQENDPPQNPTLPSPNSAE
jgi:hypothetical protein